ncbi:MAG: GGDEF domain-containing protein [Candidatus Riflebacteria bacterium]|nr:GGDEF domain-containing protein [Candidatus Riflebacteria bacterium]
MDTASVKIQNTESREALEEKVAKLTAEVKQMRNDRELLLRNAAKNRIFLDISKELASSLDPNVILRKAFQQFGSLIEFATISVLLYDELEETYRLIVQPDAPITEQFQLVLKNEICDLFEDYPADPPFEGLDIAEIFSLMPYRPEAAKVSEYRHVLHLPIILAKNVRGLIHLTRLGNLPFTPQDLDITSEFTGIFVISIKNALIHKKTEKLAFTDALTELFNHRYFQDALKHEFLRTKRYTKSLSLMILDIDFFKKFNDTYGHQTGDKVLQHVSKIFKKSVRDHIDTVARYGGEEFAVILPETTLEGAAAFAERIRKSVESCQPDFVETENKITVSIGLASTSMTDCETYSELIEAADRALYRAKRAGRNRVEEYRETAVSKADS